MPDSFFGNCSARNRRPLTNGDWVSGPGLNPGIALHSAPGVATLNATPTLVTVSGLNWAISANTNYQLVGVGNAGASYGLVHPGGGFTNAFASVSGTAVVPLPPAVLLFASALGLAGAMRRRQFANI